MSETTTIIAPQAVERSAIDWAAVIGGALIASALSFVLFAFGSAAGVASYSPYSWDNPSVTTLSIIGVAWFCVVMIGSFLVGGFFAGRYRRPSDVVSATERESRDGAHGLLVWALSLVIGIVIATMIAGAATRGAATVAGGAAAVATQAVPEGRLEGIVGSLLRPGANSTARAENPRAEIARIFSSSALMRGEISNEERDYVARIIATETGTPPDEARKRVDSAIEQAKQAANAARKVTAALAFLIGAVSIIAAGAAYWAATAGGRQREDAISRF